MGKDLLGLDRAHFLQDFLGERLGHLGEKNLSAGNLPRPRGLGLCKLIYVSVEAVEDDLYFDRHKLLLGLMSCC
jgi:hypothetical protein